MNKKLLVAIALTLTLAMSLSSCGFSNLLDVFFSQQGDSTNDPSKNPNSQKITLTDTALNTQKVIDFANGADSSVLFESDGWSNGDVFNVVWKQHNVFYENGIMRLDITEEKASAWLNDKEVEFNYTAGEARTQNYYHYGDYEVSMKPSANAGTASTFFICTGPYDLKDGKPNPHDEIDIEFLGKDTTHVQFNFFVDGKGGNEYMYDLGFDASKEFHTYGFRWAEDSITWFVDGKPVYKVTTDKTATTGENVKIVEKLPSTAGRMLANYWCGNERAWAWMGEFKGSVNDNGTQYQWIATSAEGNPLNPPVVVPPVEGEETEINWADIAPIVPAFPSAAPYVVAVDGNKANVTYTDVSGSAYMPIELDVTDAVAGKNYVSLTVTNNGTETVNVRVNMFDPTLTGNNKASNISATMNGEAVRTDLDWGGSFFDIPAGESAELVIHFGVGGIKLQLMIDSSRNDTVLRSGDITVEDIKFATVGEVEVPHKCEDLDEDGKCDGCGKDMPAPLPPAPADPTSGDLTAMIGGVEVQLGGNTSDGYGVNANDENGSVTVAYTNISTNTYKNVWAAIGAIAEGKNEVSLKIKNNGTETAYITVKIETATAAALMEGKMEIPAGEEQTFTQSFEGAADKLYFFIDSGWSMDNTTHAGEVIISDIAFAGESAPVEPDVTTPEEEEEVTTPEEEVTTPEEEVTTPEETTPEVTPDTGLQLNFWTSSSDYTANGNNIQYNGAGNSYSCAGSDISAIAKGNNTFIVTITNNGTAASRVRVDIQATNQVGNHTVCNVGAVGGDVWTDFEWGGSTVTVPAGQSVTLVVTYDENTDRGAVTNLVVFVDSARGDAENYSSNVTLSGMSFSKVGGEEPEETTPEEEVTTPVTPEFDLPTDGGYVKFEGNLNVYNVITESEYANVIRVTYNGVSTNTYQNISTWIKDKADGNNNFSITLANNGAQPVYVTVKLETVDAAQVMEGKLEIAVGEMHTYTTAYAGEAALLYLFIDSGWSEATTTHSGDITIAGIKFYTTEAPAAPVLPTDGEYVKFEGNLDVYNVITESEYANIIQVTYEKISTNTYQNINTWIADKSAGKTNGSVTIRNNGSESVRITVKFETAGAGVGEQTVEIAAGEMQTVSIDLSADAEFLYLFIGSGWSETTTASAGDISIAGIHFQ